MSVHAEARAARKGFPPLAGVRVNVSAEPQQVLIQIVDGFAQAHHFRTEGDVPLSGLPLLRRQLVEREIDIIGQSNERNKFFLLSNFRREDIFELMAYSHESKEVWSDPWNELISLITARFGEASVTTVQVPPEPKGTDGPNQQDQARPATIAPPPVVSAKIKIQRGTRDDVLHFVEDFINEHHFGTKQADFPIDGRLAIFRKIVIDADTFILLDNSRDESEVEIFGFSRTPDGAWLRLWRELTSRMQAEFSGPPQ